jgi:hypothetical protein
MLALPDELADYRSVVREIATSGERAAIMFDAGWVLAGLSGGAIDVFDGECIRRPEMCARALRAERVALVRRAGDPLPERFALSEALYAAQGAVPNRAGALHWRSYRRVTTPPGGEAISPP